jgi:hypothetical protein
MKPRSRRAWPNILICAAWGLWSVVVDAQGEAGREDLPRYSASPQAMEPGIAGAAEPATLLPYSKDAADIATLSFDDQLAEEQVARFAGTLERDGEMSDDQQARMVALLSEERAALLRTLAPAGYDVNLLLRAVQKGVALDEASLQLMQDSLERLLARLADVLSPAQLQQFASSERQKLSAQRRLLQMRRNSRD